MEILKLIQRHKPRSGKESDYHYETKYDLAKLFWNQSRDGIASIAIEKMIGGRRADVYVSLKTGENVAIEIQNSIISLKDLRKRTRDYNKRGIYVLWLLNGNGPVCAQSKVPESKQTVRLSALERHLHFMYGGRVYYLNKKEEIIALFGLHYTCSLKRKYRNKRLRTPYSFYYIMDQDPIEITDYNILSTQFRGIKIARFFDKNLILNLMDHIRIIRSMHKSHRNKGLLKLLVAYFSNYNESLVYHAILRLIEEGDIKIKKRYIPRSFRNYYSQHNFHHKSQRRRN